MKPPSIGAADFCQIQIFVHNALKLYCSNHFHNFDPLLWKSDGFWSKSAHQFCFIVAPKLSKEGSTTCIAQSSQKLKKEVCTTLTTYSMIVQFELKMPIVIIPVCHIFGAPKDFEAEIEVGRYFFTTYTPVTEARRCQTLTRKPVILTTSEQNCQKQS